MSQICSGNGSERSEAVSYSSDKEEQMFKLGLSNREKLSPRNLIQSLVAKGFQKSLSGSGSFQLCSQDCVSF